MKCELAIIGAGPAGLAAAAEAATLGIETTLIDEQAAPGGQIYRRLEGTDARRLSVLGTDYADGLPLIESMRASSAEYLPNTTVWSVNAQRRIGILCGGKAQRIEAEHVILASGAIERPVPFSGWTLPGVMNAGAAQILLKSAGMVAGDGVVLAGTGPLLLLLAWQYLNAGVGVRAVLEVAPKGNLFTAAPRMLRALSAAGYVQRWAKYQLALRRRGVPIIYGIHNLAATGQDRVQRVTCQHWRRDLAIDTDALLVHFGVIPNNQLSYAAGCDHHWNEAQQCWRPSTDRWGSTSVEGVAVAGDGASIDGATAAAHKGRIAALHAARRLGHLDEQTAERKAAPLFQALERDCAIRPFVESLHRLPQALLNQPADDVVVCRCEEITAGEVRRTVADGHRDANQVKFLTRCGMGPCQGQQCAPSVTHIVAAATGQPMQAIRPYRSRPPLKPLTIAQLSELG